MSANYKGKNPMTRSQWRRFQRNKKAQRELTSNEVGESSTNQTSFAAPVEEKSLAQRRLFAPKKTEVCVERNTEEPTNKEPTNDEDMLTDNFDSDGESSLNINCNVVFLLPHEYDQVTEVEDSEEADELEMAKHKPMC